MLSKPRLRPPRGFALGFSSETRRVQVGGLSGWGLLGVKVAVTAGQAVAALSLYASLQSQRQLNNHHYYNYSN